MSTRPGSERARADACPGVLRLTAAADGSLARVRLVGGFLTAQGISALVRAAGDLGDGRLELTSRGNVQLRGLRPDASVELGSRLREAGLWPSQTHERVRNIIASPLAGLDRDTDVSDLVHELDRRLCATGRLAELSGRFLFAIDDGRADMAALQPDITIRPDGLDVDGLAVADTSVTDPVGLALACAEAFLDEKAELDETALAGTWRVADLSDGAYRVRSRIMAKVISNENRPEITTKTASAPITGRFQRFDGGTAAVLTPQLGHLSAVQLRWLCEVIGERPARVTPWRSIVLPDVDDVAISAAAELGFGVSADSPWAFVSACTGQPGCAKALADVQADASAQRYRWPGRTVRWSGCARRCGRMTQTQIDVIATTEGYQVTQAYSVAPSFPVTGA